MVGYTSQGASDSQWFANEPVEVWKAVKSYVARLRTRSSDERTMRLEVNLGMGAFTGSVIATMSVQPAPQGGSVVQFSGRMGAFSQSNIGAQRRIESERSNFFAAIAKSLPAVQPMHGSGAASPPSVADELAKLAQLLDSGLLTVEEFNAQKAKLLR